MLENVQEIDKQQKQCYAEDRPSPDSEQKHAKHESAGELKKVRDELVDLDARCKGVKVVVGRRHADGEGAQEHVYDLKYLDSVHSFGSERCHLVHV